jgi:hypothetical protein
MAYLRACRHKLNDVRMGDLQQCGLDVTAVALAVMVAGNLVEPPPTK